MRTWLWGGLGAAALVWSMVLWLQPLPERPRLSLGGGPAVSGLVAENQEAISGPRRVLDLALFRRPRNAAVNESRPPEPAATEAPLEVPAPSPSPAEMPFVKGQFQVVGTWFDAAGQEHLLIKRQTTGQLYDLTPAGTSDITIVAWEAAFIRFIREGERYEVAR